MHEWLRFKDMSAERKEGHCYVSISGRVPAGSANRFMKLQPSLARIWRCLSELLSIKDNPSHTLHCTTLLRQHSSFSPRLIKPCCQEKRLRESLLTFSVRLYTNFFLWQCYFSPTGHTCFPCETPISAMGVHLSATGVFTYVSLFTP